MAETKKHHTHATPPPPMQIGSDDLRPILEQLATALDLDVGRLCAAFILGFAALIEGETRVLEAIHGGPLPTCD